MVVVMDQEYQKRGNTDMSGRWWGNGKEALPMVHPKTWAKATVQVLDNCANTCC